MRRFGRRLGAVTIGVSVLGLVLSTSAAHGNEPGADSSPVQVSVGEQLPESVTPEMIRSATGAQTSVALTLVTGDQVHVGIADGDPVVREIVAAPRSDGREVVFHTVTRDDNVYVVPADALSLVGDTLDWELFNLAKLAEHAAQGTVGEVPVIVSHAGGFSTMRAPQQVEGAEVERTFDSIDASAMTIDGSGDWWQQVPAEPAGGPAALSSPGALAGVDKVWLNELHEIHLGESVPQVGAPVAWDNGYDGSGVKVAVLDTGIDADHPDVADNIVEAVDFTGSPNGATDGNGHGTHVASTIAGTGAASDGLRSGVAPGAELAIGRVCDDGGSCPSDAILAGMEWAAQSGAQVINMSLGSGPTDGTDPLSQMVNQLSAQHDVLFSISAGNSGPAKYTVGAPGAADAALTVAAVDKSDEMADFSSRGPRVGDDALKPDIAAPGVDIIAARAAGTGLGTPVDDSYTTASGTSMSAPHVTGGVAVVAQAHPDLSGQELKALLMGTSLDLGHELFAQGAGRMDLARAIDPSVFSGGNLDLGRFTYPHEEPVSDEVTFHNVTDQAVTLSLSGSMTAGDGSEAPEALFALDSDEVTAPAEGSAGVGVTVDGSVLGDDDPYGVYNGVVEARDSAGDLRAASRVRIFLEPESFQLTIDTTAPDGATGVGYGGGLLMPADDETALYREPLNVPGGEDVTMEVFPGSYSLHTSSYWRDASGTEQTALPAAPEVTIEGDTTVEFDLNQAEPAAVELDQETETYSTSLSIERVSSTGGMSVTSEFAAEYGPNESNVWLLPSEEVEHGALAVTSNHSLVTPAVSMRAIGGGPMVDLAPRYATPDVSVQGPTLVWGDSINAQRSTQLPVPRLELGPRPVDLAYGGTGTAEDLAGVDVDGKLALITPTEICHTSCEYAPLADRVAAAADAGAAGVLVVGDPDQVGTGRVELPLPEVDTVECPDGRDSCPEIEPYAAAPVLTVPAEQGHAVIDRLSKRPVVKALVRGDSEVTEAYGLSFVRDSVPGDLPFQVDSSDLDRVEHRIHDDAPTETSLFSWTRHTPDTGEEPPAIGFPNVATQQEVTTFVGPAHDNAIDRFQNATIEFEEPYVVAPPPNRPEVGEGESLLRGESGNIHERVLSGDDVITWNSGPEILPGAVQRATTDQGFVVEYGMCAGCREGNTLWPMVFTASSSGDVDNGMTGMINDTGAGALLLGVNGCGPPRCEIDAYDAAGDELAQTITPIQFSVGLGDGYIPEGAVPAGDVPAGLLGVTGAGVIEEGTSR